MPLPILQSRSDPAPTDLVRLFHRTEVHWSRHVAEETALDVGTAFTNPALPRVWTANGLLEAALPEGTAPPDAVAQVQSHYVAQGVRCKRWVINPSAPQSQARPLVEHFTTAGWVVHAADILHLGSAPLAPVREAAGLTIIPARASFRHARQLAEEAARCWDEPQIAEAALLHLDDPHYDALIALRDGVAVGRVGVLAVGDVGRVDQLFVGEKCRRQGIGRSLMSRAMEICARSLFRHVMLSVAPDNEPAQSLYRQLGFRKVGQIVEHHPPS